MLRSTHSKLLDVVDNELATGGLHNPPAVGGGVVGRALADGDTLSHSVKVSNLVPWCVEICVPIDLCRTERRESRREPPEPPTQHVCNAHEPTLPMPTVLSTSSTTGRPELTESPRAKTFGPVTTSIPPLHSRSFRSNNRSSCRRGRRCRCSRFSCRLGLGVVVDGGGARLT